MAPSAPPRRPVVMPYVSRHCTNLLRRSLLPMGGTSPHRSPNCISPHCPTAQSADRGRWRAVACPMAGRLFEQFIKLSLKTTCSSWHTCSSRVRAEQGRHRCTRLLGRQRRGEHLPEHREGVHLHLEGQHQSHRGSGQEHQWLVYLGPSSSVPRVLPVVGKDRATRGVSALPKDGEGDRGTWSGLSRCEHAGM